MQVVPGIDVVPHNFVVLDEILDSFSALFDELASMGVDPIGPKHPNRRRLWGSTSRYGSIDAYGIPVRENRDRSVSIYIPLYDRIERLGSPRYDFLKIRSTKAARHIVAIRNGCRPVSECTHRLEDRMENRASHSAEIRLLGSGESFSTEMVTWSFLE